MKRQPHEPRFYSRIDIARRCGCQPTNVTQLAGLPEPYDKIGNGWIWRAEEIDPFVDAYKARRAIREAARAA